VCVCVCVCVCARVCVCVCVCVYLSLQLPQHSLCTPSPSAEPLVCVSLVFYMYFLAACMLVTDHVVVIAHTPLCSAGPFSKR